MKEAHHEMTAKRRPFSTHSP